MIIVTDVMDTDAAQNIETWTRIINDYVSLGNGDPVPHVVVMNKVDLVEDKEEYKERD